MSRRRGALGLAIVLAACALGAPARAQGRSDAETGERIRFIEQRLELGTAAANRWWYGWYSIYGGLTLGQAAIAFGVSDPGLRIDMAVGAFTTSLGSLTLGIFPFQARFAAARVRALPEGSGAQRRAKLAEAEAIFRSAAEDEAFGRSWASHLIGNGVALASGIVLGVGYDRPASGILQFAAGVTLTELQILTQPTRALEDWNRYAHHGPTRSEDEATEEAELWVVPEPGGLGLVGRF
jgi:hypothetical protein